MSAMASPYPFHVWIIAPFLAITLALLWSRSDDKGSSIPYAYFGLVASILVGVLVNRARYHQSIWSHVLAPVLLTMFLSALLALALHALWISARLSYGHFGYKCAVFVRSATGVSGIFLVTALTTSLWSIPEVWGRVARGVRGVQLESGYDVGSLSILISSALFPLFCVLYGVLLLGCRSYSYRQGFFERLRTGAIRRFAPRVERMERKMQVQRLGAVVRNGRWGDEIQEAAVQALARVGTREAFTELCNLLTFQDKNGRNVGSWDKIRSALQSKDWAPLDQTQATVYHYCTQSMEALPLLSTRDVMATLEALSRMHYGVTNLVPPLLRRVPRTVYECDLDCLLSFPMWRVEVLEALAAFQDPKLMAPALRLIMDDGFWFGVDKTGPLRIPASAYDWRVRRIVAAFAVLCTDAAGVDRLGAAFYAARARGEYLAMVRIVDVLVEERNVHTRAQLAEIARLRFDPLWDSLRIRAETAAKEEERES